MYNSLKFLIALLSIVECTYRLKLVLFLYLIHLVGLTMCIMVEILENYC